MSVTRASLQDPLLFRSTLDLLPAGAYTCDPAGRITWFNGHAVALWGREPALNDDGDRFCGSFRLLSSHLQPIAHDGCWMAMALRDRREYLGHEIVIERPDRRQVTVLAYATPLIDDEGELTGAVNLLVDISDRKRVEQLLTDANRAADFYRGAVADAMRDELAPMHVALAALEHPELAAADRAEQLAILRQQLASLASLVDHLVAGKAAAAPPEPEPDLG